jgi:endoglucanase
VDCGGGACPDCPNGDTCSVNGDCQSNNCVGGLCQPLAGAVTAVLGIPANWAGGYCAVINVTNNSTQPTTTWSVSLNTNQATIYTSWNGNFPVESGAVTVTPAFSWNQVIAPGATNDSVGFCANRNVSGSGTLPFVVSASGSF